MQQRVPQLDAVRGLAVLLVILSHAADKYPALHLQQPFSNGWMGVDLFFVLSGFLITGILLDTRRSEGYLKNFYARRCLRIWPLYYSVLLLMFVIIPLARPSEAATIFEPRSSPWWAYPLFLQNFLVPVPTNATGPLGVTWSLAIEEQFYLIWPWVVRYCSQDQLKRIAVGVICISPLLRFYLSLHHVNIYTNFFCRLDGLMAGALLALVLGSGTLEPSRFTKLAWSLLLSAVPLALLFQSFHARWIVLSFTVVAASSFIYLSLFSAQSWFQRAMTNRFLVYTGTISYGLYLLHKIPFDAAQSLHLDSRLALALAVGLAGGFALAFVSWNVLEKPCLRLKRFFRAAKTKPLNTESGDFAAVSGKPVS